MEVGCKLSSAGVPAVEFCRQRLLLGLQAFHLGLWNLEYWNLDQSTDFCTGMFWRDYGFRLWDFGWVRRLWISDFASCALVVVRNAELVFLKNMFAEPKFDRGHRTCDIGYRGFNRRPFATFEINFDIICKTRLTILRHWNVYSRLWALTLGRWKLIALNSATCTWTNDVIIQILQLYIFEIKNFNLWTIHIWHLNVGPRHANFELRFGWWMLALWTCWMLESGLWDRLLGIWCL